MTQDLIQFDSSQNFESHLIRLIDQSNLINQILRTLVARSDARHSRASLARVTRARE